jgi:quinoprotein dehydrogenase-associated probable ABC transporter substrate-binding protein
MLLVAAPAQAQTIEAVDRTALRVCADPNNLPFSNENGEGFENKIAELLAAELKVPVRYAWYPQATGFLRNTLWARRCDVVLGMPGGSDAVLSTNPYYRSTYALVYPAGRETVVDRLDDPALKSLRIGLIAGTPPSTLLAQNGLMQQVRPYHLVVDTRYESPAKTMIEDLVSGEIDVGILWGPLAGYYAGRQDPPLKVVLLLHEPAYAHLDFWIAMGVRPEEVQWKHDLNTLIERKQADIERILKDYGVPLLDRQGQPMR